MLGRDAMGASPVARADTIRSLQQRVRDAADAHTPLVIRGGGTKDFYGNRPASAHAVLDPRSYCGVIDYEPTELVITACSGTPLAAIEAALAERGQMLAFEPPYFGASATIGGAVAGGLAGPRRMAAGSLRDFVLGASLLDGRANVLTFGGKVVKNVAGYDVSRVLAGSLGTLGLILDVSLKVVPRPAVEVTIRFAVSQADAIRRTGEWAAQPLPVSGTVWFDGALTVRLSGAASGVRAAAAKMGGTPVADDAAFWSDVREHRHLFFQQSGGTLWRLSVPPTTTPLGLGETLIEWRGAQRWIWSNSPAAEIRSRVQQAGGHVTAFRSHGVNDVFHPLAPALMQIHRRLKAEFDPAGIFNPGRMYLEL